MAEKPTPNSPFYEQLLAALGSGDPAAKARSSASVVPWRRASDGIVEVYWVRRNPKLRFMGGWHAFPGGGQSRSDAALPVAGSPDGTSPEQRSMARPPGASMEELPVDLPPGLVAAALRELFEETGLLLAVPTGDGGMPDAKTLDAGRRRLLDDEVSFAELLDAWQLQLDASTLSFAGRWLTPPLAPMRFDNRFFLLHWSADQAIQPTIIDGELVEGQWIDAAAGLATWRRSEILTAPPIVHFLRVLSEDGPDGIERLREPVETCWGPMRHVEFRPGVHLLPLRTPTLPPATHTNAFLLGHREMVLVDPATPFEDEQQLLLEAVRAAQAQGAHIRAIWLTHHHIDHIGAVELMRRELNVPVLAHAASEAPLARAGIQLDGELRDGQQVVLDGGVPCPIRVHHTPGHTRGHLCFLMEEHRALIAGDLVSALSTIVIDPPEGDMTAYLTSLEAMLQLEPDVLFPAHGPAVIDGMGKLDEFYRHRVEREEQVQGHWQDGVREPGDIVKAIYTELPPIAYGIAERQVLAHLERLVELERIEGREG